MSVASLPCSEQKVDVLQTTMMTSSCPTDVARRPARPAAARELVTTGGGLCRDSTR